MFLARLLTTSLVFASFFQAAEVAWKNEITQAPDACFVNISPGNPEDVKARKVAVTSMSADVFSALSSVGIKLSEKDMAKQVKAFLFSHNLPVNQGSAENFSKSLTSASSSIISLIKSNSSEWKSLEPKAEKYRKSIEEAEIAFGDYLDQAEYKWTGNTNSYRIPKAKGTLQINFNPSATGAEWAAIPAKDFAFGGELSVPPGFEKQCNPAILARLVFQYQFHGQFARNAANFSFACDNYMIGRFGLKALAGLKDIRAGKLAAEMLIADLENSLPTDGTNKIWTVQRTDLYTIIDALEKYVFSDDDHVKERIATFASQHK